MTVGIINLRRTRMKNGSTALDEDVVAITRAAVADAVSREERRELSWSRGEDEQVVATALELLARYGWTAVHDVHWPGRPAESIGHVAIGPGGVVVIDAKDWDGTVSVDDGVLRHRGYRCERDVDRLAAACSALASILPSEHRSSVIAVVCVTVRDLEPAQASGVLVAGRLHLASALVGLPPRLTPLDVADVTRELARGLVGRPSVPITDAPPEVFLPTQPTGSEPSDYFETRPQAACWPGDEPPAPPRTGPREESGWSAPTAQAPAWWPGGPEEAPDRLREIIPVGPVARPIVVTPLSSPARGRRRRWIRPDVVRLMVAVLAAVLVGQNNMEIASAVSDWLEPAPPAAISTELPH